jgi:hypothetical protein
MNGEGKTKFSKDINLHLKKQHHQKFLRKQGFTVSHEDLTNTEHPDKVYLSNVHPTFHKRYRHAIRHKKNMRIQKADYAHFGQGLKEEEPLVEQPKKTRQKKTVPKDTVAHSSSSKPKYLHLPNSQMLAGVQLQSGTGYELPLSTDVHTFSTRKRIKNKS